MNASIVVLMAIVSGLAAGVVAQAAEPAETVLLWPDGAPGAMGNNDVDKPCLLAFPAPEDKATGAGIVVCPGGGYGGLAMDHEGYQVAHWLNANGVSAFILKYRVAPYKHPIPLGDVQRAIRLVRTRAEQWRTDPGRLGVLGFSAGGHLASSAATHFDAGESDAADVIDRKSSRPDFAVLIYPVIAMDGPFCHRGSRANLLGEKPSQELVDLMSNEKQVTPETPPIFLVHSTADSGVPVENSVQFYLALRKAGVPAEMHIYEKGEHGFGLGNGDPVLSTWPGHCMDWLGTHGFLKR